jgi:hypothetical protein
MRHQAFGTSSFAVARRIAMESIMRKLVYGLLIGSGLLTASAASAQRWDPGYWGRADSYSSSGLGYAGDVCSGRRAHRLERWLNNKVEAGGMDDRRADRIHSAIDETEDRARHECREGDWRAIADISNRYDRIAGWIRAETYDRWRDRW